MAARASRRRLAVATALSLFAAGCGGGSKTPAQVDGVYRVTTSAAELAMIDAPGEDAESWGDWTLVLDRGRFAITRENDRACTWAYGALGLRKSNAMDWTVIDGGGVPPGAAANQPRDSYRFSWNRYRDVLTLDAVKGGSAGYFAAKPWRRIAETPTAHDLSRRCPPPAGALAPNGAERATPSRDAAIGFSGDLVRTGPTTWEGGGTSTELGRGRLTIDGNVVFQPPETRTRLTFAARFSKGELRGCAINAILRRPYGRYLWEGDGGQITGTSPALRRYLGLEVSFGGVTRTDSLTHMHGGLRTSPAAHRRRAAPPRDLC
jgi:hypothetical protein